MNTVFGFEAMLNALHRHWPAIVQINFAAFAGALAARNTDLRQNIAEMLAALEDAAVLARATEIDDLACENLLQEFTLLSRQSLRHRDDRIDVRILDHPCQLDEHARVSFERQARAEPERARAMFDKRGC